MNKALLIIDVQNDFVSGSLGSEYAKETVVPNVIKLLKQFDIEDVYATQDTHFANYMSTSEGSKLPVEHCIKYSEGWKLVSPLNEIIPPYQRILKFTFGAKPGTLRDVFEQYGEIHICGLCTDICVVSNALILKALFPEKKIVLHTTACGGTSKENHLAAVQTMLCCQIEIEE